MYFVFLYSKINVMTKLSVNINKVATLRNARGGKIPNVINFARDVQEFGAQGVTIHPRPDQRHIRYQDALDLKLEVHTEYNIEGNPIPKFIDLILKIKPTQVTLVPDSESAITSNAGWDCKRHGAYLEEVVSEFKRNNIRTSIFLDPDESQVESAVRTGVDRIELYTELFANEFSKKNYDGIKPYINAAELANNYGIGLNAGHDLSLDNIHFFKENIPFLLEVSIGHALICESLYFGIENVIKMYLHKLK